MKKTSSKTLQIVTRLSVIPAVVMLAACGGGGGTERASYSDLASEFVTLGEETGVSNENLLDVFSADSLPTTGSETYNGVFSILLSEEVSGDDGQIQVLGDMRLVADFGDSEVRGGITDFSDNSGDTFDGSVSFSDGFINRTADDDEDSFGAFASGTIESNDVGLEIDVDGYIGGAFLGDNYQYAIGGFVGELTSEFDTLSINFDEDADGAGVFIAER